MYQELSNKIVLLIIINTTLLEMVKIMMAHPSLSDAFLSYALERAACIINLAPTKSAPLTPYDMCTG